MILKPSLTDLLKSSIRSILKNKSRTLLTSLGIIIGVTSVILLTSIGNGLKIYINDQFESLGSNLVFVAPGKIFNDKGGFNNGTRMISLSFDDKDLNKLKKELRPATVFPATQIPVEVKYGNTIKKDIQLSGVTEDFGKYRNFLPKDGFGRWLTDEENDKKTNVAVLGYTISKDLFKNSNPLNKKIVIAGKNFKVIGIIEKKGSTFGGPDLDSFIFVPISVSNSIRGKNDYQAIQIKTQKKEDLESVKKKAKKILLDRYDEDSFTVFDSSQLISSINSIINMLTLGLTGIAAISLIVGGIGIMNIMLVTVSERTKEIGLRKAIGAYPRAILLQFLFEAIILSGIGGGIGILLGAGGTFIINKFFPAKITIDSVILAFGVSSLVGIIFGVAPARKASKLSPIEALRYE